jgi:hypothetical protein
MVIKMLIKLTIQYSWEKEQKWEEGDEEAVSAC